MNLTSSLFLDCLQKGYNTISSEEKNASTTKKTASLFKKILKLSFCLTLLPFLGGCYPEKPSIKIGINTELSGEVPSIGASCRNAADLFAEEINRTGGLSVGGDKIPLKLIIGDNSAKADQAATVAQRLISQEGIVALVGPNISSCAIPAAEIAESLGCLMISPLSTNQRTTQNSATEQPKKYVFRACFSEIFEEFTLAQFAIQKLHASKAAILYDMSSEAPNSESKLFKKAFMDQGCSIVALETYSTGDRDFSAQLTKIKAAAPDIIFLPAYYNDVPLIAEQAHRLGLNIPFLGNSAWSTPEIIQLDSGHHLEGACFSNHFSAESTSPKIQQFVTAYKQKYGQIPDEIAALTYDSMGLIATAISNADSLQRDAICKAMEEIRTFDGLTGAFNYPVGSRDPLKSVLMLQLKEGAFSYVTTVTPGQN